MLSRGEDIGHFAQKKRVGKQCWPKKIKVGVLNIDNRPKREESDKKGHRLTAIFKILLKIIIIIIISWREVDFKAHINKVEVYHFSIQLKLVFMGWFDMFELSYIWLLKIRLTGWTYLDFVYQEWHISLISRYSTYLDQTKTYSTLKFH